MPERLILSVWLWCSRYKAQLHTLTTTKVSAGVFYGYKSLFMHVYTCAPIPILFSNTVLTATQKLNQVQGPIPFLIFTHFLEGPFAPKKRVTRASGCILHLWNRTSLKDCQTQSVVFNGTLVNRRNRTFLIPLWRFTLHYRVTRPIYPMETENVDICNLFTATCYQSSHQKFEKEKNSSSLPIKIKNTCNCPHLNKLSSWQHYKVRDSPQGAS